MDLVEIPGKEFLLMIVILSVDFTNSGLNLFNLLSLLDYRNNIIENT